MSRCGRIGPALSPSVFRRMSATAFPGGGRMWWAHPGFTRINIELTILTNGLEENPDILDTGTFSRRSLITCESQAHAAVSGTSPNRSGVSARFKFGGRSGGRFEPAKRCALCCDLDLNAALVRRGLRYSTSLSERPTCNR